jgi:hypothetical protein
MSLGRAALFLVLGGVAVYVTSHVSIRCLYWAVNASSKLLAVTVSLAACAFLFVVSLPPLFALMLLASGTVWAEGPLWFLLLAAWLVALAPGFRHFSRHSRTIKTAFSARWVP